MLSCIYGEVKTREELYKMKKEKRLIESGESIKKYVQEQYGEWNIKNLQEFWFWISKMNSYNIEKIPKQNQEKIVKRIIQEIYKLMSIQELSDDDVIYLGSGQDFWTIGVGKAVVKIERSMGKDHKVLEVPYRLNPKYKGVIYQDEQTKEEINIYISERARTENITQKDVQKMYNVIRKNGGIWLDPKEENIGILEENGIDFEKYYEKPDNLKLNRKMPKYNGPKYIIDYGDIIFLDPKIVRDAKKNGKHTGWAIIRSKK